MEFLAEFIIEVLLEGIFGLTIENPKVKTWVKTLIFVLVSQALTVLFALLTLSNRQEGRLGTIVMCVITVLWCVGTLIGAIYKHRTGWKQND